MKLSDSHLVMLSKATQRGDRCVDLPRGTTATTEKLVAKLAGSGLIEEIEASGNSPVWRTVEDQRYSLRITDKGMDSIGLATDASIESPKPKDAHGKVARNRKRASKAANPKARSRNSAGKAANRSKAVKIKKPVETSTAMRSGTKIAEIVRLLSRKHGASISEMMAATDWQSHSVRGALSGTIRKKLRHKITSEMHGETRRYHISGAKG